MLDLPVSENWYQIDDLGDGIFKIFEPHVAGFMKANAFVVRGRDDTLLIDALNGVRPLRPFLADYGLEPTIVLATHAHADHIGGLHEWPLTLCHSAEAEGLRILDPDVTLASRNYDILDLQTLLVQDDRLHGPIITALPHAGFTSHDFRLHAPQVEAIEDGHVINLGDRQFEVLHLPGHSPGGVGLWDASNRILFGGDTIYDGKPYDKLHHSSVPDNRQSLQRLLPLNPRVVYGGHEQPIHLERFRKVIEDYLAQTA
ncbi:glyoxylase-like metal-dependent hydrolase (beta-lactamase superfamily II) [Pararhizobium capsulatum DSM 1112]|uniref:Glyoxylase-like metal-dependent hydrolase (Beta-lactamase superfamily II) n=1 Tax=Pararhizobium capsulatum DSM 1112 TaxID=1121113 RepID=A0ABU0C0E3_9HYPH|nr:MBL fold metallo-hydrolase [Pararhizobium capsulatum]MDQ0323950.1 glyoxylase-like metal-dependent hydrolase (beta-lactamase superfamily II) [Pararhizobium capsulatum DSM 1112]